MRFLALLVSLISLLSAKPLDLNGTATDPFQSHQVTVLLFVRSDCPISNRYAPEVRRLYDEFTPHGVAFWLVYADKAETPASIRKHVQEYGYAGKVLLDPNQELVPRAKAHVTPEAAVFTPDGRLVYHGRIDDRYVDFGKSRPSPTRHDLEEALTATLAGKPVPIAETKAVGCFLADLK